MMTKEGEKAVRRITISFVIMVAIVVIILSGFAAILVKVVDLGHENQHRIFDIQQSRIESCERTYRGISEVFKPFFPPKPRTKEQQADLDKLNRTITHLIAGCEEQVKRKVTR